MKNWFKSLSKVVRTILCIAPMLISGACFGLYASYQWTFMLIIGTALVILSVYFLWLGGKVEQEEKFQMTAEEEAEHKRKNKESEQRRRTAALVYSLSKPPPRCQSEKLPLQKR